MTIASNDQRWTEFIQRLYLWDYKTSTGELTQLLGMPPTSAHIKGELRIPGHIFKRNMWTKESASFGNLRLDHHVSKFLKMVAPLLERIKTIPGPAKVELTCHINDYGKGYVIYCDPHVLHRLSEINASLEIVVHTGENEAEAPHKDSLEIGFVAETD